METPHEKPLTLEELRQIPLFAETSTRALSALLERSLEEVVSEGDLIFTEGQRGDRIYIVLQGSVRLSRLIEGVGEEPLSLCHRGMYFGELALFDEAPRSAHAQALEPTRLLVLRKADFEELLFADPLFAREILWVLVSHIALRLRETNEKLRAAYQMQLA